MQVESKCTFRSLFVRKGCFNLRSWQSRWQNKVSTSVNLEISGHLAGLNICCDVDT